MYILWDDLIYIAFDWVVVVENFGVVTGGLKDLLIMIALVGYGRSDYL